MNNNSVWWDIAEASCWFSCFPHWKPWWFWLLFRCCGVSTPFPALNRKSPRPRLTRLTPPSCPVRRASAASTRTRATRTSPSTAASAAAGSSRCCRPSVSVMMDTKDKPSYHQRSSLWDSLGETWTCPRFIPPHVLSPAWLYFFTQKMFSSESGHKLSS